MLIHVPAANPGWKLAALTTPLAAISGGVPALADCEIANVWPPKVMEPVRAIGPLASIVYVALVLPVPLTSDFILIQNSLMLASHGHPRFVAKVTVPEV